MPVPSVGKRLKELGGDALAAHDRPPPAPPLFRWLRDRPGRGRFVNADEAYITAARTARTLMATDTDAGVDWLRCMFEVADDAGEVVFELPFSEAVEAAESPKKH